MTTRREFLQGLAAGAVGIALPMPGRATAGTQHFFIAYSMPVTAQERVELPDHHDGDVAGLAHKVLHQRVGHHLAAIRYGRRIIWRLRPAITWERDAGVHFWMVSITARGTLTP